MTVGKSQSGRATPFTSTSRASRGSFAVLAFVLASLGCAHATRVRPGFNVSSTRSDYSPTVRLAVSLPLAISADSDSVVVRIDSAIVSAPGPLSSDTLPVMRDLYLVPLLATRADPDRTAKPLPPWLELATGDSVLLVDALRLGEERRAAALRLSVIRPQSADPARTWLVFRISGAAVTTPVRLDDGSMTAPRAVVGGVRVFACADWTLAGFLDAQRRKALARAYTAAC